MQSQGRDLSYEEGVRSQEFLGRARMLHVAEYTVEYVRAANFENSRSFNRNEIPR